MEHYDNVNYYKDAPEYNPEPCHVELAKCTCCGDLFDPFENDLPDLCNACFHELTHYPADNYDPKAANY
jgi:hypothetical protein